MAQASRTPAQTTASSAPSGTDDPETKADDVATTDPNKGQAPQEPDGPKTPPPEPEEPKRNEDYWVTNAYVSFGQEPGIVRAAYVGAPRKNLTEAEAKTLVSDYLKRPVGLESHLDTDTE